MSNFTFNGAAYRLIIPALNQSAPAPEPGDPGAWVHIPYGGNKFETDGTTLQTIWSPEGGIMIMSSADYATFNTLRRRFGTLTTPWGTFRARLARLNVVPYDDDTYRGTATWEWA